MPPKAAPSGAKASNGAKVAPLTAAAESRVAWGDADPDAAIPTEELAEGLRSEAEAAALKAAQFDLDGLAVKPQPRSSQHGKHQMQPPPPMPPPTPPKPYGRTGHVIHLQHLVCVLTLLIVGLVAGLTASLASVPRRARARARPRSAPRLRLRPRASVVCGTRAALRGASLR